MDPVCPPSGGFGVYNHHAGVKQRDAYPYNNHEGGEADEQVASISGLQDLWAEVITECSSAPAAKGSRLRRWVT